MGDVIGHDKYMFVIGLTGGIGTGKTAVATKLQEFGLDVVNTDQIGHQVYASGTFVWRKVVEEFGEAILSENGDIDRKKLGSIVFSDRSSLEKLNQMVHPMIRSDVESTLRDLSSRGRRASVLEAALLFEACWASMVDEVWVTVSSRQNVLDRVTRRTGLGIDEISSRIDSQMSQTELAKKADVVIGNNGSLSTLRARVEELWIQRILPTMIEKP